MYELYLLVDPIASEQHSGPACSVTATEALETAAVAVAAVPITMAMVAAAAAAAATSLAAAKRSGGRVREVAGTGERDQSDVAFEGSREGGRGVPLPRSDSGPLIARSLVSVPVVDESLIGRTTTRGRPHVPRPLPTPPAYASSVRASSRGSSDSVSRRDSTRSRYAIRLVRRRIAAFRRPVAVGEASANVKRGAEGRGRARTILAARHAAGVDVRAFITQPSATARTRPRTPSRRKCFTTRA